MMDWLLGAVDPSRVHDVGPAVSWHARIMVLAWGILAPLSVLVARYFKVLPGQNWPKVLDNQLWWRAHWIGQTTVLVLTALGVALVWAQATQGLRHGTLGYSVLILGIGQILLGIFRGSKGGPSEQALGRPLRGAHYDMSPRRVFFEWSHKLLGYLLLGLAIVTIVTGLWAANAPRWMWLVLLLFWSAMALAAVKLQRAGFAVDTYQAIWGPGREHPGNRRKPIGFGITRKNRAQPGE